MPQRILIANDDGLQSAVLRTELEGRGYEVEVVGNGLEAVRRLRTGRYDLALLDYMMPAVDRLVAARLLQDLLHEEDRPRLIALTAATDGLREREAASGGSTFDAVVSKRDGLPALVAAIETNLSAAADLTAAAVMENGRKALRDAAREAATEARRRRLAPFGALPGLVVTTMFVAASVRVATSFDLARNDTWLVLIVLALGALHGFWTLGGIARQPSRGGVATPRPPVADTWHRPMPPPLAAPRVPSSPAGADAVNAP